MTKTNDKPIKLSPTLELATTAATTSKNLKERASEQAQENRREVQKTMPRHLAFN